MDNGETTIEQLAKMTATEFTRVNQRIDVLENKMDTGFKAVLSSLENIEARIGEVKQDTVNVLDYARLERRLDLLEEEVEKVKMGSR